MSSVREIAKRVLTSELHALPAPRTLTLARELVAALRADGVSRGHAAYLASEEIWAYVRPCPGMSDRELGRRLLAERRMHLVTRNLACLIELVLSEPDGKG